MNLQAHIRYSNKGYVCQVAVKSVAIIIVSFLFLERINAQKISSLDPFETEYPLEFSTVIKAIDNNDYDQAIKLLSALRSKALKSKNITQKNEILVTLKEVNRLKREFAKVRKRYESLKNKSNSPEDYMKIGKFYCSEKNDWKRGLLLLSKSDVIALRTAAIADLKRPVDPTIRANLSDAWWDLASQEKGKTRKAFQLRSRYWYLLARPALSREDQGKRQKRLQLITLETDKIVIWNQHNEGFGDRGAVECIVTLFYKSKLVWRQLVQMPWSVDTPAAKIVRPPHIKFDQVRVDINQFRGNGGGLGEIEIFDGNVNVGYYCSVTASEYYNNNRRFHPSNVINGDKTGGSGFWLLPTKKKGWVAIDLVNFLQEQ